METISEQQAFGLLGQVKMPPIEVPDSAIKGCKTEEAAHRLCMERARPRLSYDRLSEALTESGIPMTKGRLNKIFNADYAQDKPARSWRTLQVHVQQICNNRVIDRWAELYEQRELYCQMSEAELAVREELAELNQRTNELKARLGVA